MAPHFPSQGVGKGYEDEESQGSLCVLGARELLLKIGKMTAPQRKHWFDKRVGIMLNWESLKK